MITNFYVSRISEGEPTGIPADATEILRSHRFGVKKISGLTRPTADVNRSALAGANASRISGSRIAERNIVLEVDPRGAGESNRLLLYDILPFDTMLRFYIVTEQRFVYIDGYVESIDGDDEAGSIFGVQISIICPFPWFQSIKLHTTQLKLGDNIIRNDGDIPSGFRMEVEGRANMVQLDDFKLTSGGDTFATKSGISAIAPVELNTFPGNRTFKCSNVPISGNKWKPSFYFLAPDSKFPKIPAGKSTINVSYSSAGVGEFIFDNLNTLYWRDTYSGV